MVPPTYGRPRPANHTASRPANTPGAGTIADGQPNMMYRQTVQPSVIAAVSQPLTVSSRATLRRCLAPRLLARWVGGGGLGCIVAGSGRLAVFRGLPTFSADVFGHLSGESGDLPFAVACILRSVTRWARASTSSTLGGLGDSSLATSRATAVPMAWN